MLQNYFKIALRNLRNNKVFSIINIGGLAMSMSVCLLIMSVVADQLSYDQFHVNKDRIYMIQAKGVGQNDFKTATTALPLADRLVNNEYDNCVFSNLESSHIKPN